MAEGSIYVTNLVMTTNLQDGDTLLYKDGSTWYAWEISGGNWVSVSAATQESFKPTVTPPASEVALACGTACWLNRATPSNTFYLYGQVNAAKTPVTVAAGTGTKPTYTIVGCPYEAGDFNVKGITGAEGDTVVLMSNAEGNKAGRVEYTYTNSAWRVYKQTTPASGSPFAPGYTPAVNDWVEVSASEATVPAGCGFMYGRKKNETLTINWN